MTAYAEYHAYCNLMNEAVYDSFMTGLKGGYSSAKGETEEQYKKYGKAASKAISKASGIAATYSKKLGIPPELATALIASGMLGGASAIPFAAIMYFVKKPVLGIANKVFDKTWDAGEKAVDAIKNMGSKSKLQPESLSFKNWLLIAEAENTEPFLDRLSGGVGRFIGRFAGNLSGLTGKVAGTMKKRLADVYNYVTKNPKEIARAMFLIGVGAVAGGVAGKITHDLKDMIVQKVKDVVAGVPAEEVAWLRQNIVLDPAEGGGFATRGGIGAEELLQQGDKSWDTPEPPDGEGRYIVGGTSVTDKNLDNTGMIDALTDTHSGGKSGFISTQQVGSKSLEDAYRDAAKQMGGLSNQGSTGPWNPLLGKTTGVMPSLRDLNVNPEEMIARYGRSAADEIGSRLATPDTYSNPAATAGGVVGAISSKNKGQSLANKSQRRRYDVSSQSYLSAFPR